jgi:hypothetical protein
MSDEYRAEPAKIGVDSPDLIETTDAAAFQLNVVVVSFSHDWEANHMAAMRVTT